MLYSLGMSIQLTHPGDSGIPQVLLYACYLPCVAFPYIPDIDDMDRLSAVSGEFSHRLLLMFPGLGIL